MSKPTVQSGDLDAAAAEIVEVRLSDSYGLAVVDLSFLGGELDRNYRVSTTDGQVFLAKLRTNADGDGRLNWQKDILLHMSGRPLGVAVPTLVRTVDGDLDVGIDMGSERWLLTVLNWVSGTDMVRVADHSADLLFDIGVTAARVTKALAGFESASIHTTHHWDVTRAGDVIEESLALDPTLGGSDDAATVLAWFRRTEPMLAALPAAMVHNDLNDNNILVGDRDGEQRVVGILDFNDALYTVRVAEPAIASAYAMLRKDDPLAAMGLVIGGYHSVTPLTDDELISAYPLAAARLAMQALTWGTRDRTDPTAYGAMRMQHTLPTLHQIVQIDPYRASEYLLALCGRRRSTRQESRG